MAEFIVVLVHLIYSVAKGNSDILNLDAYMPHIDAFINFSPAMPVFFLISGILMSRAAHTKKVRGFLNDQVRGLLYPYILWSLLTYFATVAGSLLGGGLTNKVYALEDILRILYNPLMQYWYLYGLFVVAAVYVIMRHYGARKLDFLWLSIGLFIGGSFISLWSLDNLLVVNIARYAVFFAIGVTFSDWLRDQITHIPQRLLIPMSIIGLVSWAIPIVVGFPADDWEQIMIIKTLGMLGLLSMAVMMSRVGVRSRWSVLGQIRWWGSLSLQIYLVHMLVIVGFRIVVVRLLGLDHPIIYVGGSLIAGIYVPIALHFFFEYIGFKYAFRLPKVSETKPVSTAQIA